MTTCPAPEALDRLLDDALGEDERPALEEHVAGCPLCQESLARRLDEQAPCRRPPAAPGDAATATVDRAAAPGPFLQRLRELPPVSRAALLPRRPERAPAVPDLRLPSVPGYEVLGVLGHGGMAVVYKARHQGLKRLVALKMILAGEHASPDQRRRFHRGAEATAPLARPHIVPAYPGGATT